jgi:hypothetical protein
VKLENKEIRVGIAMKWQKDRRVSINPRHRFGQYARQADGATCSALP